MTTRTLEPQPENPLKCGPPSELIQRILAKIGSVKMLPDVAVRALEIAKDPNASIVEFSEVVQLDIKLAAGVLSMANSVLYAPDKPIANLTQGVSRLGFTQCKNLIIASSLASVMKEMAFQEQWIRDVLWKHSVATGVIATQLNRELKLGLGGEEFTAGLVHDIGRTLLAVALPETFAEFDPMDFDESAKVLVREHQAIGCDHCDIGAWFADDQGLPDVLVDVILFHHTPEASTRNQSLVALIATADHMASYFQRCGKTEGYDPTDNPGPPVLESAGAKQAVEQFQRIAADVLATAIENAAEMSAH